MRLQSIVAIFLFSGLLAQAQKDYQTLDAVMAVVGDEIILYSDIEIQKAQLINSGYAPSADLDCQVLESLLFEKLLLQ